MSNPRGRPTKRKLVVSPEQKLALRQLIQQPRSSRSLAFRARIVLECARGQNNAAVAARLHTSGFTVGMWRNRFITGGIAALGDEVRPGAPRQIGDDKVECAVRLTLEKTPKGATHWSSRCFGNQNRTKPVHRQPHLAGLWTEAASHRDLSAIHRSIADRQSAGYCWTVSDPPHHAMVLCVDEKSQIQASQPYPARAAHARRTTERRTHDYKRHGITSLFAALDIATGKSLANAIAAIVRWSFSTS